MNLILQCTCDLVLKNKKIARLLETHVQSVILYSPNPKSLQKNFKLKLALIQDYSTQEYIIETHENYPKTKNQKTRRKKNKTKQNYCSRFRTQ
jgi:hypothetical protein